jgi:uncharacterized repeat protein (TIGR01451 family)
MTSLRKRFHYFLLSGVLFAAVFTGLFWLLNQAAPAQGSAEPTSTLSTFDLQITKSVTPTSGPPGSTVTFTIVISNNGPQVANDLIISDTLPPEMMITHISLGAGFYTETITPTLSWSYPSLNSGERSSITITGIVSPGLSGGYVLTNTAVISQSINRPLPVLMAGASSCPGNEIYSSGSSLTFSGNVHSNGDITKARS